MNDLVPLATYLGGVLTGLLVSLAVRKYRVPLRWVIKEDRS